MVIAALVLLGGGAAALGEQHRAYAAAVTAHEEALASLDEAVAAAGRAAADENLARAELSDAVAAGEQALEAVRGSDDSFAGVADEIERGSALLGAPRADPPVAPGPHEHPLGADRYLRAAAEARAVAGDAEAFAGESRDRAEGLRAASKRLEAAWADAAKQAAGGIDAAIESNQNAAEGSRSALAAIAEALRSPGFSLSEDVLALWAGLPSALAKVVEEQAAYEAQQAAARAAVPSGGGGSRGGSGGGSGGGGAGGGVPASEAGGVLGETNVHRAANGLGALSRNSRLVSLACSQASVLATRDSGLSHASYPGGFGHWAENVASGFGSAAAVVTGWMGSPPHRANLLGAPYTQMGACVAQGASGTLYWAQQFGS